MRIFVRSNHVGWIHVWASREAFLDGEPSLHFFNGRNDPRWQERGLTPEEARVLAAGELLEIEDPGYLTEG